MLSDDDMLLQLLMLEAGIVPFRTSPQGGLYSQPAEDADMIDRRIESLEPDQRRAVKRKFRKLWRKAAKHFDDERIASGLLPTYAQSCGVDAPILTPSHRITRRKLVIAYLRKKHIAENKL